MNAVLDKDDEHVSRQFKPALHISYHAPSCSRIEVLHEAATTYLCLIPSYKRVISYLNTFLLVITQPDRLLAWST